MKKNLVGNIVLDRAIDKGAYPFFVINQALEKNIYYINEENELDTFAHFSSTEGRGVMTNVQIQNNYLIASALDGTILLKKDSEECIVLEKIFEEKDAVLYQLGVLSDELILCKNVIYSLKDYTKRMEIENYDFARVRLVMAPSADIRVVIIDDKKRKFRYMITIDIVNFKVISENRKSIIASTGIINKISEELYIELDYGTVKKFSLYTYQGKLLGEASIAGNIDAYDIDVLNDRLVVFMEEGTYWIIDYKNECMSVQRKINANYNSRWNLEKIVDGKAYFQVGKKSIKCVNIDEGTVQNASFKNEINATFIENNTFFVSTIVQPERDYRNNILVKQGNIDIFTLN